MPNSHWQFEADVVWKQSENLIFGFGRKNVSIDILREKFKPFSDSPIQWAHLNQIHSATVLHSEIGKHSAEAADAHFTFDRGLALVVKTADCIPALIFGPPQPDFPNGVIAAVHAGWRGIENEILVHTVRRLKEEGYDIRSLSAAIGPHIRANSFEVDFDVASRLCAIGKKSGCTELGAIREFRENDNSKSYLDLGRIAKSQLIHEGLRDSAIEFLEEKGQIPDTKTSLNWASYRRDGANAGRNHSFILRL